MNWNKDKSLKLSIWCVRLFAVAVVLAIVFSPQIDKILLDPNRPRLIDVYLYFMAALYVLCIPAVLALIGLYKLLKNISTEKVFIDKNVSILRGLSWDCFIAAAICAVSAIFYLPFLIIAAAAAFMGLILRVVKNVFAEAVAIKQDNDFTI